MALGPFESGSTRATRFLAFLSIVFVIGVVFSFRWIINPSTADDRLIAPADAIVILTGGDDDARLERALELRGDGRADLVVIPNGAELDWADANALCVSDVTVLCPSADPDSTRGQARALAEFAEDNEWDSLIMVTSTHHLTRAALRLDRCFDGTVTRVEAGTDFGFFDWVGKVGSEWIGLADAHVIERGC